MRMPIYKQYTTFELARKLKAFFNLEAGFTRGAVLNPEQLAEQARLLQEQSAAKDQHIQMMREQLENGGREIDRLRQLANAQQSAARDRKAPELVRRQAETNGQAAVATGSGTPLYLDLMKRCLKNAIYDEGTMVGGFPANAHTMLGFDSLDNVQFCVEDAIANDVPGDFIETGVWRGGTTIFARAIFEAHGVRDRKVWVADSFEGLPPPDAEKYPHDAGDISHTAEELAISVEQVQANFERYGLLDDQVKFLKGWFSETLPDAPIEKLAVARLDGDMYESTMDGLVNLYPKLSVGGYLIVDDYGAVPACRQAVHDYREEHGIDEEIHSIDWTGVYWQRTA